MITFHFHLQPQYKNELFHINFRNYKGVGFGRSRRLLQTRKIIDPLPLMVRMERDQPRIQNQVSIFICFIDFLFITEIKCQESYMEQLKKDRNPKAAVEFSSM